MNTAMSWAGTVLEVLSVSTAALSAYAQLRLRRLLSTEERCHHARMGLVHGGVPARDDGHDY